MKVLVQLIPILTIFLIVLSQSCSQREGDDDGIFWFLLAEDYNNHGEDNNDHKTVVSLSGKLTFDSVPATETSGLNYEGTIQKPSRGIPVIAETASTNEVVAIDTTNDLGQYRLENVPSNTLINIMVPAMMYKEGSPSWDFGVVDNTRDKGLYTTLINDFNSGSSDITDLSINISSGWDGSTYSSSRAAAPFAILDVVYQALDKILEYNPNISMPPLLINWSVNNIAVDGDETLGQIGTSHYKSDSGEIYLLGYADNDTDEYDDHIIAHEFGHYFENNLSRSDSPHGLHSQFEKLDPRVAFSEGLCDALSGIVTDNPLYIDTMGQSQSISGIVDDLEDNNTQRSSVGWYSQKSVQCILYDLYDSQDDGPDSISLGVTPIFDILMNEQCTCCSCTSIHSFISLLKQHLPSHISQINSLISHEDITTTAIDNWDSTQTETNDGGYPQALPLYSHIYVGGIPITLCTNIYEGYYNKLMNRKFFFFDITVSGQYTITASADGDGDPCLYLYRKGELLEIKDDNADGESEVLIIYLTPDTYLGEISDYCHIFRNADSQWCDSRYSLEECFQIFLE